MPAFQPDTIPITRGPTEGERKQVTVLFSDLSGYAALSERLDPEEIKEITSRIFGEVARVVSLYDGFVEKYIGDAVVALFGVPKSHEDDHIRALKAAREIHQSVNVLDPGYVEKIGTRLTFHSGIATGLVVTGEVNLEKGTHGVAGDTINLASRLSGLATPGEILVGESTYLQSKGMFSFERLHPVFVKGKAERVIPYRLLEEKVEPARGLAIQGLASPLIDRTAEVTAIKGCLNRLLDNQGGIFSLIGEAGLGKSRLMAEIRHAFAHEDLLWLVGKTLSYGQKMSYWPFREILWLFTGITEDDNDVEAWEKFEGTIVAQFPADSGEILPYLASLIGLEVRGEFAKNLRHLDGESMGKQIYLSSRRFFERLAHNRPLVLVFEDLHWADESTVLLIEHLFPLINRVPLLMCGVSRPEEGAPAARLRDTALKDYERRYTEIRLNPLSPIECTDLMNNLLNIENLPPRTRQLILQKAEGNPFFVEEIMRTLLDRGAVRYENGHWKATSRVETITIPNTIQGVIMARIDRLDDEVKQVLEAASVIGRAFLYRLLKKVTEPVRDLDRHLNTLTAAELIREKQKVPELEYVFKHALVQESTYESILLKRRLELHGKAASAIETLFADRRDEFASVLAYHYAKAEQWEKAQEYLFKAGDQAGRIAADAEALTHYQQALETYTRVFGDKWDPIQRGVLERKMGEAFYRRGEYDQAMEYLQRALVYFGRPRLPTSRLRVGQGIVREAAIQAERRLFLRRFVRKTDGVIDRAFEELLRIYEVIETIDSTRAPDRFLLTTLTCLNLCERKGFAPGVAMEYSTLRYIAHLLTLSPLDSSFRQRSIALAEETQHTAALVRSYLVAAIVECETGQLRAAIAHGLKGAEICRREGYPNLTFWAFTVTFTCISYYYLGAFREALQLADELIRTGEDVDDPHVYTCGLTILGVVQERQGYFQDCVANLQKAIEVSERIPDHELRVFAGYTLSRCYLRLGDIGKCLNNAIHTAKYRAKHKVRLSTNHVALTLFQAYLAQAEQCSEEKREEWLRRSKGACKKALRWAQLRRVTLPETVRSRGVYEWLLGRRSGAEKHWRHSIALCEEMGMRYDLAMTHLEMGRRLDDHEHLRQAEAIFDEIGAEWDLEQVRRYLPPFVERKEA
jgi:class 3 adenylate cyclase/tetratricopeptide (TPR) repeat protein